MLRLGIDYQVLIQLMERRIKDAAFMRIIRRLLKAGYCEEWTYHKTYSGTPQGGTLTRFGKHRFARAGLLR